MLLLTPAVASIGMTHSDAAKAYHSNKSHLISCSNCGLGESLLFFEGLFCNSCKRKGLCISCLAAGAYSSLSPCTCPDPRPCFNFGLRSPQVFACKEDPLSTPDASLSAPSLTLPPAFPYEKFSPNLKEPIRLLRIHPGHQADKVKFTLQTHSLLSCPDYEAISYRWGGAPIPIYSDAGTPFLGSRNLVTALVALRHPDKPRMLWADAICINQGDKKEREQQVKNMANVYRQAAQVLVWLGPGDRDTEGIFGWISGERKRQIQIQTKIARALRGQPPEMFEKLRKYANVDPKVNATMRELVRETVHVLRSDMDKFLEKPYFTRVWVVQEIYYATSIQVVCGSSAIDWDTFVAACSTYAQSKGLQDQFPRTSGTTPGPSALAAFRRQKSLSGPATLDEILGGGGSWFNTRIAGETLVATGRTTSKLFNFAKRKVRKITEAVKPVERPCGDLLTVLTTFWSYNATDPLDKIYALRNLVRDCDVEVNYDKSLPELFKDVAIAIMQQSGSLELLTMANCARKTALGLPSWVPDWTNFDSGSMPLQLNQAYRQNVFETPYMLPYTASGNGKSPMPVPTRDGDILTVSGYLFDGLGTVGLKMPNFNFFWNSMSRSSRDGVMECLFNWDSIGMSPPSSPTDQSTMIEAQAEEAYCLTLSRGTYWVGLGHRAPALAEFHKWRTALWSIHQSHLTRGDAELAFLADEDSRFSRVGISSWRNYTLARAKAGSLVMGIGEIKEGDEIALLKGCALPLIVRHTDVPGRFKLVGAAYVHGIMEGQAWIESKCRPMQFG